MAITITDNGEYLDIDEGGIVRSYKKKYITTYVDEPYLYLKAHEKELRENHYTRKIDFNDVSSPVVASAADLKTTIDEYVLGVTGCGLPPVIVTGDYTLQDGDDCQIIGVDDAGGLTTTVTIPPESSVNFDIGTRLKLYQLTSATNVDIVGDTGVVVNSHNGWNRLHGQYAEADIIKTGSDEWLLYGDIKIAYDPDAEAFIDAVGTLSETQAGYVNTLVEGLKTDGLWTKMIAIYPIIGGTASAHKWNLKNPVDSDAAFRATFTGSPTHAATGITFNGSSQYANTHVTPTTNMTQNNTGMTITLRNNVNTGVGIGLYGSASSQMAILPRFSNVLYDDSYNGSGNRITVNPYTDSTGTTTQSRTSSTSHKVYKNGVPQGSTDTAAVTGWSGLTYKIYFGAWNSAGSPAFYCAGEYSFVAIHEGLTDTQAANLYTRISNFNTNLSR